MSKKIIEILVTPQGETTVQTRGFTGPSCQEASRFLEAALGERVTEARTAEFYQTQSAEQQTRQQS